jgi:predicted site-specific integrase-resolvase
MMKLHHMDEELIRAGEAARRLCVDPRTLANWRKAGRIPAIALPTGRYLYRASDIAEILCGARSAKAS